MANAFQNMMMQQFGKIQRDIQAAMDSLEAERVEASSGGGVVRAVATGAGELLEVIISPEVVDPDDVEMLQDLVVTAVREAVSKANELRQQKIQEALGPLAAFAGQMPGLF
jgi:DNA-binding YbaB/EbfC family protein